MVLVSHGRMWSSQQIEYEMTNETVLKPYPAQTPNDETVRIAHLAESTDASPPPAPTKVVRRRLPPFGGLSWGNGRARVFQVDETEWAALIAPIVGGIDFSTWTWGDLLPSPPLVEFTIVEGESKYYSLVPRRAEKLTPPYLAFAELALPITDEVGYGIAAADACKDPRADMVESVRRFVARYGPLSWGTLHDCHRELVKVGIDFITQEWARSATFCNVLRNTAERYVNSVPWVLGEALQMRRALAVADALRIVRSNGRIDALRQLWGWERGKSSRLFDQTAYEVSAGARWEEMVQLSALYLQLLIDHHVGEARVAAEFSFERWPRRSGGRFPTTWLTAGITSPVPLINLWLNLFDDLLWLTGEHACEGCGNGFSPRRTNQAHCSPSCGARVRNRRARAKRRAAPTGPAVRLPSIGRVRR